MCLDNVKELTRIFESGRSYRAKVIKNIPNANPSRRSLRKKAKRNIAPIGSCTSEEDKILAAKSRKCEGMVSCTLITLDSVS